MPGYYFALPESNEQRGMIIGSIPEWIRGWVDGVISVPDAYKNSPDLVSGTGYRLSSQRNPEIVGRPEGRENQVAPDYAKMLQFGSLPEFLVLEMAGYQGGSKFPNFNQVREIIQDYISRWGYLGNVRFCFSDYENLEYSNPARVHLKLQKWKGAPHLSEKGPQPARIKVSWYPEYGGTEAMVAPVLAVCRGLKLREYRPRSAG